MKTTSFEETGKEDEFVNGYGGSRTAPPIDSDIEEEEEDENDFELDPDEEIVKESTGPKEYVRPDDYDLLTPDEQDKYDKLTDTRPHRFRKTLGNNWPDILNQRSKELEEKYYKNENEKNDILEKKEILEEPTKEGSKARIEVRKKYTRGMLGTDEADEEALLNETAFQKYILGQNINKIPIDSLLSKNNQFAPADITVETRGGNVKRLFELKTVDYNPVSKGHSKPIFLCPLNKIANLYGYPEGINNTPDNYDRIKEVKSFKNAPSKLERKLYWTVLNRDEKENMEDLVFPAKISGKPIKAKNDYRNKVSYVDLNDKELKKDVVKYIKDNNYRPDKTKPYIFKMSPVAGNNQMTVTFKNPIKLTKTPYKRQVDYFNFID